MRVQSLYKYRWKYPIKGVAPNAIILLAAFAEKRTDLG
jgi:hypothetical protein